MTLSETLFRLKRYGYTTHVAGKSVWELFKNQKNMASDHTENAKILKKSLEHLRGPVLKLGQILAIVPDLLPKEYVKALESLHCQAPSMGLSFVRRRMKQELGEAWQSKFASFDLESSFGASLGQVHKAVHKNGDTLACKLQYPHMNEALKADLNYITLLCQGYNKVHGAVDPTLLLQELSTYLYQELDYQREASNSVHMQAIFTEYTKSAPKEQISITLPKVYAPLSTKKLLTMSWCSGHSIHGAKDIRTHRHVWGKNLFLGWYIPFFSQGYLHGDPHFGNYLFHDRGGITMLDFGCVRQFSKSFVRGVIVLYEGLKYKKESLLEEAYALWGFTHMTKEVQKVLTTWAKCMYQPLLTNTVGPMKAHIPSGLTAKIHQCLKEQGGVTPPAEFVFIDRAALGMGAALMYLESEHNWQDIFEYLISLFQEKSKKL